MEGRDAFLTSCRENRYEFSSLRRARFATLCMLIDLHGQPSGGVFMYFCNKCSQNIATRYHCSVCEVGVVTFMYAFMKRAVSFASALQHCT